MQIQHIWHQKFRLPLCWQQICQAIPTPFGVKSNKIKCENNKDVWRTTDAGEGVSMFAWSEAFVDGAGGPEYENQNPEIQNSKFGIQNIQRSTSGGQEKQMQWRQNVAVFA